MVQFTEFLDCVPFLKYRQFFDKFDTIYVGVCVGVHEKKILIILLVFCGQRFGFWACYIPY